jgi:hypothetical protein
MRYKAFLPFCIIFISTTFTQAHEGIFLKFSLGPFSGVTTEFSSINGSGYAIGTKNHGIGWAFNEKFALSITEFGGLIKKKVGEYNYINLDVPLGFGFTYYTPWDFNLFVSGGPGKVYFAHKWTEATGDMQGKGYGINMSLEKEWMVSRRVGIGTGAQAYFLKTKNTNYDFLNVSFNFIATFYFTADR